MARFDVYHMEERLMAIDENIVGIMWNDKKERHEVMAVDARNELYIAFTVKHGELDGRWEQELRYLNPRRGYSAWKDLEKSWAEKERQDDKKIADMARDFADHLYQPMLRDAYGA